MDAKTNNEQLTIIIVSYNSQEVINRCLSPLLNDQAFRFIIVDNASTDNSAERLRLRFPHADILTLPANIGYGRAANVGLHKTTTPYALLLNPDLITTTAEIQKLLGHALQGSANTAIWGPATKKSDCTDEPPKSVEKISGSAMLFDMAKLNSIGYFDKNIFLFFEENDLCKRAISSGHSIQLCGDIFFDHLLGQGSSPNPAIEYMKSWHYGWSRCYYFNKHEASIVKRRPKRQYAQYHRKALFALNSAKRLKYSAQAAGAKAFLLGEKAFLPNGFPQQGTNLGNCVERKQR
ncbi:MAG: glycosyltransferase family 2 protein [Kiritimatiellia bacterium]